jgi:hypothetical protein
MQVICAWCGELIKVKKPLYNKSLTHTICDECSSKESSKMISPKSKKAKIKPSKESKGRTKFS